MKRKTKLSGVLRTAILVTMCGPVAAPLLPAASAAPAVEIQGFGASYGEWAARWWQWILSIPAAVNPNLDATGANCAQGQYDTVWFLGGAFGGTASRTCTVPVGKPIFFPLINTVIVAPKGSETLLDLRRQAKAFIDTVTSLTCQLDGAACAPNLLDHRATSPSFTVLAPNARDALLPPGSLQRPGNSDSLVADGYWILLPPLSPGSHTLNFGATTSSGFGVNITYHLTVPFPE